MNIIQMKPRQADAADTTGSAPRLWAVGGGKGGVGKSIVSLNLAYWIAKMGHRVVLVDADLGGANLHTLLGIKFVHHTLADYLDRKISNLDKIAIDTTVPGLRLICGASDIVGLANPQYARKLKLMRALEELDVEHMILDLGAGTDFNTLDFFLLCTYKIAVIAPQPTALQNGYGFVKSALYRAINREFSRNTRLGPLIQRASDPNTEAPITTLDDLVKYFTEVDQSYADRLQEILDTFNLFIINNMIRRPKDRQSAEIIRTVCLKYLGLKRVTTLGSIPFDPQIDDCVNRMRPAFMTNTKSTSAPEFYSLVSAIIRKEEKSAPLPQGSTAAGGELPD